MLYWLTEPLIPYFQGLNLFRYISFRAAFAAILSFLIVVVVGPGIVAWLRERKLHGCVSHDSLTIEQMRENKQDVPTMGGLLILLSVAVATLLLGRLDNIYVLVTLLAFGAFGALGAVDDWAKLRDPSSGGMTAKRKLCGQLVIAAAALGVLYVHAGTKELWRGPSFESSPYVAQTSVASSTPMTPGRRRRTRFDRADPRSATPPRTTGRTCRSRFSSISASTWACCSCSSERWSSSVRATRST